MQVALLWVEVLSRLHDPPTAGAHTHAHTRPCTTRGRSLGRLQVSKWRCASCCHQAAMHDMQSGTRPCAVEEPALS